MSILVTLALMSTALVAKIRESAPPPADVEITTLKARVDDLESQVTNLENCLADVHRDLVTMRIEADRWRALVERRQQPQPQRERAIQEAQALAQLFQAQANQQSNLTHQARYQQNAFNDDRYSQSAYNLQGVQVGILGNQALAQNQGFQDFCNCVPARHDMFYGR